MTDSATLYIDIRGRVIALDRATGAEREIFCLDAQSGEMRWRNKLPGMGTGLITIATERGSTAIVPPEQKRRMDAAQSAASAAAITPIIGS